MPELTDRMRQLLVDAVRLEHIQPQDIALDANLVADLDFDSVDLLEVAMTIEDELGVKMPEQQPEVYTSLRTLVDYVQANG
jgi:acyl carrier protein